MLKSYCMAYVNHVGYTGNRHHAPPFYFYAASVWVYSGEGLTVCLLVIGFWLFGLSWLCQSESGKVMRIMLHFGSWNANFRICTTLGSAKTIVKLSSCLEHFRLFIHNFVVWILMQGVTPDEYTSFLPEKGREEKERLLKNSKSVLTFVITREIIPPWCNDLVFSNWNTDRVPWRI